MTLLETVLLAGALTGMAYLSNKLREKLLVEDAERKKINSLPLHVNGENIEKRAISFELTKYTNCSFKDCVILYSGRIPIDLSTNKFDNCRLAFSEYAAATILTMHNMYQNGFSETIDDTFDRFAMDEDLNVIDMEKK